MRLSKLRFNNHPILGNLSLSFQNQNGNIYSNIVLVGENGCGKTTILNELLNYNNSRHIIDKEKNCRYASGEDIYRSIFIRQDIKYFSLLNETSILICGKTCEVIEPPANIDSEGNLKNNKANSNELFPDEIAKLNNNNLIEIIKNSSIPDLLKGIGGLLKINNDNQNMPIESLSSGEQELALRLLSLKSAIKRNTDFIIIDEPETALHPKWQLQIFELINNIFEDLDLHKRDAQLFIATHSENVLKSVLNYENTLVIRLYKNNNEICAETINDLDRVLPYVSFPEIQYIVFGIPTSDYHNALYGYLIGDKSINKFEKYIIKHTLFENQYYNNYQYSRDGKNIETLPTYIRNAIHHPENGGRRFTEEELKKSIEFLRNLIKTDSVSSTSEKQSTAT